MPRLAYDLLLRAVLRSDAPNQCKGLHGMPTGARWNEAAAWRRVWSLPRQVKCARAPAARTCGEAEMVAFSSVRFSWDVAREVYSRLRRIPLQTFTEKTVSVSHSQECEIGKHGHTGSRRQRGEAIQHKREPQGCTSCARANVCSPF